MIIITLNEFEIIDVKERLFSVYPDSLSPNISHSQQANCKGGVAIHVLLTKVITHSRPGPCKVNVFECS